MRVRVDINIDKNKILVSHGLGKSKVVQKMLASDVKRLSDPYVAMQQGDLKNRTTIAADGSELVYVQPYAHYQFYGKVMGGRAPKHYTGDSLTYNGAPMRGAQWTTRMLADKRDELEKNVKEYIGKGGKG